MKKYLAILLIITLIASMAACGHDNNVKLSSSTPKPEIENITPTEQIKRASLFDHVLQAGNTVLEIPFTYDDLVKAGLTIAGDKSPDYIMDAKSCKLVTLNGVIPQLKMDFTNFTDKKETLKDANITEISSTIGNEIFYPGGVGIGTSLSELTKAWGEPSLDLSNNQDFLVYEYINYPVEHEKINIFIGDWGPELVSGNGEKYTVKIDRNTSKITDISRSWNTGTLEDTEEIKEELSFGKDKYELNYAIPSLVRGNSPVFLETGEGVFSVDGKDYCFVLDTKLSVTNTEIIPEQSINEYINDKYSDEKYDVNILNKTESSTVAVGYLFSENTVKSKILYKKDKHIYISYRSKLVSIDDTPISDGAISKFKDIIGNFALSIKEKSI